MEWSNLLEPADQSPAGLVPIDTAVDSLGRLYVAGSLSGELASPPSSYIKRPDIPQGVYVARYSPGGERLEYFVLGTNEHRGEPVSIAVDALSRVVVGGNVRPRADLNWSDAFSAGPLGSTDIFAFALSPDGTDVLGLALIGGSKPDRATDIAIDNAGSVFLAGDTDSADFPTTAGSLQTESGGDIDAFLVKMNLGMSRIDYATYLGGPTVDSSPHVVPDGLGSVSVALNTGGIGRDTGDLNPGLPATPDSFGPMHSGKADIYLAKLNAAGTGLVFAGYLGGSSDDLLTEILRDPDGNFIIMGSTFSVNSDADPFALPSIYFPRVPEPSEDDRNRFFLRDATFISKIASDGSVVLLSKTPRIPSAGPTDVTLGASGRVYALIAPRETTSFPLPGDLVTSLPVHADPFVAAFSADSERIEFGTRTVATGSGPAVSISVDRVGRVFLAKLENSNDLPLGPTTATPKQEQLEDRRERAYLLALSLGHADACDVNISHSKDDLNPLGGSVEISVSAPAGCPWQFLRNVKYLYQWSPVDLSFPASKLGDGTVTYTYPANDTRVLLQPSVFSSAEVLTFQQLSTRCELPTLVPPVLSFPASGGNTTVSVVSAEGCARMLRPDVPWLSTHYDSQGTGDFEATVLAAINTGGARVGSVSSGSSSVPVAQQSAGNCGVLFGQNRVLVGPSGGTVTVNFMLDGTSCAWAAYSSELWAAIVGNSSGTGVAASVQLSIESFPPGQTTRTASLIVNGSPLTITQLGFDTNDAPVAAAVVDAAAFTSIRVSSGAITTLFGTALTFDTRNAPALPLPTELAGTRVWILRDGAEPIAAELFYVSPGQINFLMPEVPAGIATIRVEREGQMSNERAVEIATSFPSFFLSGDPKNGNAAGVAQFVYPDGHSEYEPIGVCGDIPSCPAGIIYPRPGTELYISLFGTGFPSDAAASDWKQLQTSEPLEIVYAGPQGQYLGLGQLTFRVPFGRGIPGTALRFSVFGQQANDVKVYVSNFYKP